MDTKTPVAGSSKGVENIAENNTKTNINTNIMTERELNKMLSKGVDPKKETIETLTQFVRWRVQAYEQHKWDPLSDIFAEEFQLFDREDFDALDKAELYSLRTCLRTNGVYVRKGRGVSMAQALANVVQEEIPWPEDEEGRPPSKHPQQAPSQQAQVPVSTQIHPQIHHQQQAQQQQPRQQLYQQAQQPVVGNITQNQPNITSPAPIYGPNHRIPHLLPSPHQIIQDFDTKQHHGHSKELAALSKMYTSDAEKYGGSPTESLSYKFNIFMDLCTRAEISSEMLPIAFPTMLKSMALEHYYSSCPSGLTIQQLFDRFEAHFEGEEHRRNMLREWNIINLRGLIRANPDKHKGTIFNEMVQQLRQVQRSLDYEFQSDTALRNKIISACSNIPACSVAILQQTSTIAGLINNIYAAIENSEEAKKAERSEPLGLGPPTTYFTDRKYHINRPPSSNNNNFRKKQCFICEKAGCWSTKHSEKERQEAKNKLAKRLSNNFDKRYDSYVQELEGLDEQDEKDPLDIEALALDIQETDLDEAENFVTAISTVNQMPTSYRQKSS